MSTKATNNSGFSGRDVEVLCAMCQSLKSKPDVDMEKFGTLSGFSTKGSATTNLAKVLKKAMGEGTASPEAKKGGGRKRKAGDISEDTGDGEETPSKKKTGSKTKSKKDEEAEDAEEELAMKDEPEDIGADELAHSTS